MALEPCANTVRIELLEVVMTHDDYITFVL